MKDILDVIHKTIYQFFDVCGDDEEVPISDKDKLLLKVNKAICDNLKALEQEPCEDCVSRQAVLDCLKATRLKKFDFILDARERIEKLPSVTSAQKWIPVSERLPKDSVDVLATDGQLIFIAWYEDKDRTGWYSVDKFYNPYTPILAWMPLPEPYTAESEE